jgi:uncharacterized iron-regulated membrane protein
MPLRSVILKIHLFLGLFGALFLVILGLTGGIMAFEGDIPHWLHPDLWYVNPSGPPMPENDLISMVQHQYPRARVVIVQLFRAANLVQIMQLTDGTSVYVNPYDGSVLGIRTAPDNADVALGYIHQLHLRLVPDPRSWPTLASAGKTIVSVAGLLLLILVPTGTFLWWRRKNTSIQWKASWFKIAFDAHQAMGIYAAIFLLIAAFTGIMIGFEFGEKTYYAITRSAPPARPQAFTSVPVQGALPVTTEQAMDIARNAIPNASIAMVVRPLRTAGAYTVFLRVPEETSEAVHSTVTIDQFTGKVLNVRNFLTDSAGYRLIRFNRSIHTGDIFGLPTHILTSLSSLLLVAMVITGLITWWKT